MIDFRRVHEGDLNIRVTFVKYKKMKENYEIQDFKENYPTFVCL